MLIESSAPLHFWGEAILIAYHVLNRVLYKKSRTIHFEMQKGHKPNFGYLRVWGFAYVRLTDPKIPKLGIRATTCVFLDYAINSAAYIFLILKTKKFLNLVMQFFMKKNFLLN